VTPPIDFFHLTGATLHNTWHVGTVVAKGGFSVVYRAQHLRTGKAAAIKVLKVPPSFTEERRTLMAQGFNTEAQILAALDHPAIVEVFDMSDTSAPDGVLWMALEWIEGCSLEQEIATRREVRGRWLPSEALAVLKPVFDALASAHARGVIHRDLKPANMMIQRVSGSTAVTRLLDFGIAKLLDPDPTMEPSGHTNTTNQLPSFSPLYAAPEQFGRRRTGPWTDVHAMALILTEMITGTQPYGGTTVDFLQATRRAIDDVRPSPAMLGFDAGPWEAVLARALAVDARERPGVAELLVALEKSVPTRCEMVGLEQTVPVIMSPPLVPNITAEPNPNSAKEKAALRVVQITPPHLSNVTSSRKGWIAGSVMLLCAVIAVSAFAFGRTPSTPSDPRDNAERPITTIATLTSPTASPVTTDSTPVQRPPVVQQIVVQNAPLVVANDDAQIMQRETPAPTVREPIAPEARTDAEHSASTPSRNSQQSPWERAMACRRSAASEPERNRCIMNALRGSTGMRELGLYATTCRTAGRTNEAFRAMREYVARYPSGPLSSTFRQVLSGL
jgi:tRNA A-37 threonylcarbamoyl transferase component Bud32